MTKSYRSLLALGVASAGLIQAASADIITGKVTDASGEAPLQGALVTIEELGRTVSSDRFGAYRFNNIPAGDYTLSVSYVGADTVTADVSLSGTATVDLTLGGDVRYLDNVLVVGSSAAQAGAINQQRASDALINVIDSDGLGNFPDTTVADSLSRVPGLSIENDQGEGRYVSIRGINTDLISATINGVRTPSPEDRRGVLLDGVPSDLLDGIEVQKSLTPDVDADTIGGVINLKTISAFDRDGRFFRAKLEGSFNEITEEISPKGTLTYSNVFGDKLGVAASLNYQDLRIQAHNNETGGWGFNDDLGAFVPDDDYEQRFYDLTRERIGMVVNIDYRMTENTELYLRTLYNQYKDDETRNKWEIRSLDEEDPSLTGTGYAFDYAESDAEARVREEVRNIQTYAVGGQTFAGNWAFDYEISYAYAEENDSNNHDVTFRSDDMEGSGILLWDNSNPKKPVFSGPGFDFLLDPANYEMDSYEREFTINEDTEWSYKFDVTNDTVLGDTPVTWKFGMKLRDREKVRDENLMIYERDDVLLTDYITDNARISGWRMGNPMFQWPSGELTKSLRNDFTADELDEDGSNFDSLSADYTIKEKILAGYGMGTFQMQNLTAVVGARIEATDVSSTGNIFFEEDDPANVGQRKYDDDYAHFLPSLNLKYAFADNLIGRAAYYSSIVRPAFGEMRPTFALNNDRDEAEMGNPDLDPYEAANIDASIEYYPTKLSVISAGVFYKEIRNAIFPVTYDIADVPGSIDLSFLDANTLAGLEEVSTYINAGKATVKGVEFNYVQGLDFLGGAFEGFLVSANLTLADSEATLPDGREVPLLKQNDTVWNVSLGYDKGPWDLRVSANYRGDYVDELFGENLDRYTGDHMRVEASAKYELNDHLQVYLEGKNLTDEPEFYYHGNESRLSQYDEFGWSAVFGVRLTY
ncbi:MULTISPECIES: TonB-dependent receptor [Hyphomonas]|uniref:TonB-dependent receptor n=1 Tax=Hyphomonas adhaerens TaxID=81029 RepID=A0A3B9H2C4_9PROT|nr:MULTISPECIES: TonB-dependent receptor [Hyphomonas]MBB40151.1 TonB-dependent receptor [Hyphomonas sp.]HAE28606.1 TonB-dependent receptor [Hyphomonas adhaerens]|tara:strand:- start:11317 stop:14097 length:2781 start_codon:yes stop_codon:yes gene_type:complete